MRRRVPRGSWLFYGDGGHPKLSHKAERCDRAGRGHKGFEMRMILAGLSIIGVLGAGGSSASADPGCGFAPCLQLAQDGGWRERSYEWDTRPRPQYHDRGRQEERSAGRRSLRYYCSLGRQTPRSLRDDCRRAGYR